MEEIALASVLISCFCVGLRIISEPGMIFHFLRIPYENLLKKKEVEMDGLEADKEFAERTAKLIGLKQGRIAIRKASGEKPIQMVSLEEEVTIHKRDYDRIVILIRNSQRKIKKINLKVNILKPIIGCVTCMASVWTILWFTAFFGVHWKVLLVMFVVAALNTLIFNLHGNLSRAKNCN